MSGVSIRGPTQAVVVNANGQLGTATALRALKTEIRPLRSRISAVLRLEPVSYRYKGSGDRQFGLIAENVARVLPDLAQYDERGTPTGVHYDELPALLLALAQRQQSRLHRQQTRADRQPRQLRALRSLRREVHRK